MSTNTTVRVENGKNILRANSALLPAEVILKYEFTSKRINEFISAKMRSLCKMSNLPEVSVSAEPIVLEKDTRGNISYASTTIMLSLDAVDKPIDDEKNAFRKLSQLNNKPRLFNGIWESLYKAYQYNRESIIHFHNNPQSIKRELGFNLNHKTLQVILDNCEPRYYQNKDDIVIVFLAETQSIIEDILEDKGIDNDEFAAEIKSIEAITETDLQYTVFVESGLGLNGHGEVIQRQKSLASKLPSTLLESYRNSI
jgi:hypothetical protein